MLFKVWAAHQCQAVNYLSLIHSGKRKCVENKELGSNSNLISKPVIGVLVFGMQVSFGAVELGLQAVFGVSVQVGLYVTKHWSRAP